MLDLEHILLYRPNLPYALSLMRQGEAETTTSILNSGTRGSCLYEKECLQPSLLLSPSRKK